MTIAGAKLCIQWKAENLLQKNGTIWVLTRETRDKCKASGTRPKFLFYTAHPFPITIQQFSKQPSPTRKAEVNWRNQGRQVVFGVHLSKSTFNEKIHLKLFCIVFYKILPIFTSLQGFFCRFST